MGRSAHRGHIEGGHARGTGSASPAGARCDANAWLPVCRQPWVHTSSGTSLLVVPRAVEEILSSMQTDRIFDIADVPFAQVPEDEKKRYAGDIKQTGSYRGYKLRQYWVRPSHTTVPHVTLLMLAFSTSTMVCEINLSTTTVCADHISVGQMLIEYRSV